MKVLSLNCDNCGAPLEVPARTRYVTCTYCSCRLHVQQSKGAAYTEVLEAVQQNTERIASDVEMIRMQNELERVDREWQMERDQYKSTDKNGRERIPSVAGSVLGGAFAVVFGVFWMTWTARMRAPGAFPWIGLVVILVGVGSAVVGVVKAQRYNGHRADYERRCKELTRKLGYQ